jgi:hypothetical protein
MPRRPESNAATEYLSELVSMLTFNTSMPAARRITGTMEFSGSDKLYKVMSPPQTTWTNLPQAETVNLDFLEDASCAMIFEKSTSSTIDNLAGNSQPSKSEDPAQCGESLLSVASLFEHIHSLSMSWSSSNGPDRLPMLRLSAKESFCRWMSASNALRIPLDLTIGS